MNVIADAVVYSTTQTNDDGMVNSQPIKRRRSVVWNYFYEIEDTNGKRWGGKCKTCGQDYKTPSRNGTSPLLAHLKRCPKKRNGDGEEHSEMTAITNLDVSGEKFILEHRYPVTEKSLDYEDLLENLGKYSSQLQSHGRLRVLILCNYVKEKERLLTDLKTQSFGRFSLSINLSRHSVWDVYCCLILQFIDDGWKLRKRVLAFKRLEFSCDYLDLSATILGTLTDWCGNVQKKLWCITTESTDGADKTVSEIRRWLVQKNLLALGGKWSHVYCFSHFLNLLTEVGLQQMDDMHCKMRECIDYVSKRRADVDESSLPVVDRVWSQIKELDLEDTAVNLHGDLQILGRILLLKDGFSQLEMDDLHFKQLNLEEEEWNMATLIYQCLKKFDDEIRRLTASKFLTANVYFPAVCCIYRYLCQWRKNDNLCIKLMASEMKPIFDTYWKSAFAVLAIATILDPRFKLNFVESQFREIFGNDADNQLNTVRNILEEAYKEGDSPTDWFEMVDSHLFEEIDDGRSNKLELKRYLEEPTIPLYQDDVLGWWCLYESHYPRLAKMARAFLAIPMSAALSNPSFNDDIKKIDADFADLDPEIIEHIICSKYWSSTA